MMTFLSRMKVKEGMEAQFVELAQKLTEEVQAKEPDALAFQFYRLREPRGFAVFESFKDEAAEEAHRDTEHFHRLAPGLLECLDGTYVREYLDPLE